MNILMAIPCNDTVDVQFVASLLQIKSKETLRYGLTVSTMVHDARNILSSNALKYGFDRVMWLDSDMVVDADIVDRLNEDIDSGRDFVSALYFTRKGERKPVLFQDLWLEHDGEIITPHAPFYMNYPSDALFRVAGCGFGACMMKREVLQAVTDKFGAPFMMIPGLGEDISFCKRCRDIGIDIWCDSRIKCGHIGTKIFTEEDYK